MERLKNKVAIITGGGTGIGEVTAGRFVEEGAQLIVTDVSKESGDKVAKKLGHGCLFIQHDVRNEADWEKVIAEAEKQFGKLDILVNNAGILGTGRPQSLEEFSIEEMHAVGRVNIDGVLLGCKHAVKVMKKEGGSIINLSSIAGLYATPGLIPYGASKGAVRQLTKSVAASCGDKGYHIRCNSVHPGLINTQMGETVLNTIYGGIEAGKVEREKSIPVGRIGQPIDIANAIVYLASDEASFVNGAELVVDGGQLII